MPSHAPSADPYVEINLDNLVRNLRRILSRTHRGARVIAVVKDNAYGCGSVPVAQVLEREGVRFFAVARPAEARVLRKAGIRSPILVLGEAGDADLAWGWRQDIHFSLNSMDALRRWVRAGTPVRFHCKVDTGMGRLGLLPSEVPALIARLRRLPRLRCAGLFTHFACADEPGTPSVRQQLAPFTTVIAQFRDAGIQPEHIHCANSAAALRFGRSVFNLLRPGIALYGCSPDPAQDFHAGLRTVLSLKARVVRVREVAAGTPVSYGWHYRAPRRTRIATISVGYGQGLPRGLSGKGHILIRGRRYPLAGNVTMDYVMADVGLRSPVRPGDEAVAIGLQGRQSITADEIAALCGTIGYEILCGISPALERRYRYRRRLHRRAPPAPW